MGEAKRKRESTAFERAAAKWLIRNPPPKGWRGTRLEWADLEMPMMWTWWESLKKPSRAGPSSGPVPAPLDPFRPSSLSCCRTNRPAAGEGTNVNKSNAKKALAILAVVFGGALIVNTIANRVPAVDKARQLVRNGV